jgi:hypothetical protein
LKLPLADLDRTLRAAGPPPLCNLFPIGPMMQTLLSSIGPYLGRFDTDSDRVDDCANLLGRLVGRAPEREERIAAMTLDMTLQVYHTSTDKNLTPIVDWFANVWVPQMKRSIDDDEMADDILGNFIRDIWDCKNMTDPTLDVKNAIFAHNYRTHFFESDDALVRGGRFHALALQEVRGALDGQEPAVHV